MEKRKCNIKFMKRPDASQDYGRFWVKLRTPAGLRTASDEESFEAEYGKRATQAFGEIQHYQGNPPNTPESKRRNRNARAVLRRRGIDPNALLAGHDTTTRIEDL